MKELARIHFPLAPNDGSIIRVLTLSFFVCAWRCWTVSPLLPPFLTSVVSTLRLVETENWQSPDSCTTRCGEWCALLKPLRYHSWGEQCPLTTLDWTRSRPASPTKLSFVHHEHGHKLQLCFRVMPWVWWRIWPSWPTSLWALSHHPSWSFWRSGVWRTWRRFHLQPLQS